MADELSMMLSSAGGFALSKVFGPSFEHLGKKMLERIQTVRRKSEQQLSDVGREPQSVEPKLLFPIAQAAALESDEYLSDLWTSLLANAADPAQHIQVQLAYVEILKQLSFKDAFTLQAISDAVNSVTGEGVKHDQKVTLIIPSEQVKTLLRANQQTINNSIDFSDDEFYLSIDNLVRLRLCEATGIDPVDFEPTTYSAGLAHVQQSKLSIFFAPGRENIIITYLGLKFLSACKRPTKTP